MADPIRAALERLVDAVDGRRWDAKEYQDAIAAALHALATPPAEDGPAVPEGREPAAVAPKATALPADYIDPEHAGEDRRLLQIFYSASLAEGGTADEINLRGIQAVLAAAPAPVEGEVGKLVAKLRRLSCQNPLGTADPTITRAAALLQQQVTELAALRTRAALVPASAPAPVEGEVGELEEFLLTYGDHVMDEYGDVGKHDQLTRAAALLQAQATELATLRAGVPVAIPGEQWLEDDGACIWWRFPIEEPPWVGDPRDDDWPGYHTHFTRIVCPIPQPPQGGEVQR